MSTLWQAFKSIRDFEWALVFAFSLAVTTVLALVFGWYWPLPAMASGMSLMLSAIWFGEQP